MNTINILCFGDSNTWGFIPGSYNPETDYLERYARDQRWTGLLQEKLGSAFHVIEEGLNGRNTNIDAVDMPGRNGASYFPMLLESHGPLNLVLILLGMNDCKTTVNRSADDILEGFDELLHHINNSFDGADMLSPPQVLLCTYPLPVHENGFEGEFVGAMEKLAAVNAGIREIATDDGIPLLDIASKITLSDIDGIHFDEKAHQLFADELYAKIKELVA